MLSFLYVLINSFVAVFAPHCFGLTKGGIAGYTLSGHAQGTTWHVTYYSESHTVHTREIDSIFNSIDSSLSIYKPYALIVQFNNSNRGVIADHHLKKVIEYSLNTSRQTNNLSDITVGPLTDLWGFGAKETMAVPSKEAVNKALQCVGSRYIKLAGDSLIKLRSCVKIDVNGIAQGYTVDVIALYLKSRGLDNFIVEVGGEITVSGVKQPGGEKFKVGIESPSSDDFTTPPMQKIVAIHEGAITTSGNYRKFHESKGKRYSHIIDPRTGSSTNSDVISVTVYANDATTADAYDNALMLMSVKDALQFIEKRPQLAAFIIYRKEDGSIADTASSRFKHLIQSKN